MAEILILVLLQSILFSTVMKYITPVVMGLMCSVGLHYKVKNYDRCYDCGKKLK